MILISYPRCLKSSEHMKLPSLRLVKVFFNYKDGKKIKKLYMLPMIFKQVYRKTEAK